MRAEKGGKLGDSLAWMSHHRGRETMPASFFMRRVARGRRSRRGGAVIQLQARVKWSHGRAVGIVLIGPDTFFATFRTSIAPHQATIAEGHVYEAFDGVLASLRVRRPCPFVQTRRFLTGKHRLGWCFDGAVGGRHPPHHDRFHTSAIALGARRPIRHCPPLPLRISEQALAFAHTAQNVSHLSTNAR